MLPSLSLTRIIRYTHAHHRNPIGHFPHHGQGRGERYVSFFITGSVPPRHTTTPSNPPDGLNKQPTNKCSSPPPPHASVQSTNHQFMLNPLPPLFCTHPFPAGKNEAPLYKYLKEKQGGFLGSDIKCTRMRVNEFSADTPRHPPPHRTPHQPQCQGTSPSSSSKTGSPSSATAPRTRPTPSPRTSRRRSTERSHQ